MALAGTPSRVRRNARSTLVFASMGIGMMAVGALLAFVLGGKLGIGGGLGAALAGFAFVVGAYALGGEAPCPACGATLHALSTSTNSPTRCLACGVYAEGDDGLLFVVPPNRVTDRPTFSAPVAEGADFPESCAVCGRTATRTVTIEVSAPVRDASSDAEYVMTDPARVPKRIVRFEVPHCPSHDDGVAVTAVGANRFSARFRSYAYERAFRARHDARSTNDRGAR